MIEERYRGYEWRRGGPRPRQLNGGKKEKGPYKERRYAWMAHDAPCGCGVVTPLFRFDRTRVSSMPSRRASQKRKVPDSSDGEPPLRGWYVS
jgi:hypothetical protein